MQYFKRLLLSIIVATGAISSANAFTQDSLQKQMKQVDWVNPYNSTRIYDFGLDRYGQESEAYIGIKAGQMLEGTMPKDHKERVVDTGIEALTADVTLDKYDEPIVYGVYGGYTWANGLGLEVQYYEGKDADIDDKTKAILNGAFEQGTYVDEADVKGDINLKGYGLSGTYKHRLGESNFYIKGKVGASYIETKEDLRVVFDDATRENAKEANQAAKYQLNELMLSEREQDFESTPTHEMQKQELATVVNDTNIILSGVKLDKKSDNTEFAMGVGLGYNFKNNLSIELEYEKLSKDNDMITLGIHRRW